MSAVFLPSPEELLRRPDLGSRYRVEDCLGSGAQGSVWRASDRSTGAPVAVKVLGVGQRAEEFERLRRLSHPGIVRVLDTGRTPDDRPWFTMRLVRGRPFGAPGGSSAPAAWPRLVARLLDAVAFLHERGWIHGDLKPDNVMRPAAEPDRVVLLDFGLAAAPESTERSLRGTPGWIAPEVLAGGGVSPASDLYSVGVIAYTALTGRAPFATEDPQPGVSPGRPLPPVQAGLPAEQLQWTSDLLAADPSLRPRSAREAIANLEALVGERLLDAEDRAARLGPVPPLGRGPLLRRIRQLDEDGGVLLVIGPGGSGRSALLHEARVTATLAGRPARLLELGRGDGARKRVDGLLLQSGVQPPEPPLPQDDEDPAGFRGRLEVFEAELAEAVRLALAADPALLLVDDLDPATRAGRAFLRALASGPAMRVVATLDAEALRSTEDRLLSFRPAPRICRLEPLAPADVRLWLATALGTVRRVDELAELLHEATGGWPAALVAATRDLAASEVLVASESTWSWQDALVKDRLRSAAETEGEAPDPDPVSAVRDALEGAEQLMREGEGPAALRLLARAEAHPELGLVSAEERLELARAAVRAARLAAREQEAADRVHALRDALGPDHPLDAELRIEEVNALVGCSRWEEALNRARADGAGFFDRADDDQRGRLAAVVAGCLMHLGRADEAIAAAEPELARAAHSPAVRVSLAIALANIDWHRGRADRARIRAEEALAALPDSAPEPLRAAVEGTLGTSLRLLGRFDEAAAKLEAARERFRRAGYLQRAARAGNNLGIARYQMGDRLGAIQAWEDFRAVFERLENDGEVASALNNLGCLYRDTGQLKRAVASFEKALDIAARRRFARLEPMAVGNLAEAYAVDGRRDDAEQTYARCIALSRELDLGDEEVEACRRLAQLRADHGDPAGCRAAVETARAHPALAELPGEAVLLDGLEALARVLEGDPEGAATVREVLERLEEAGSSVEAARLRLRLAEALTASGSPVPKEPLLAAAEEVLRPISARPELVRIERLRKAAGAGHSRFDQLSQHYSALLDLVLSLARERDLGELLSRALDRVLALLGEERGYVLLLDEDGRTILHSARQIGSDAIDADLSAISRSATRRVMETRRPIAALDIGDDQSLGKQASVMAAGLRSIMCAPIQRAETLLGVFYVDSRVAVGGSAEQKLALLTACSDAVAVAIENTRLVDALGRKNDAMAILAHELRTPLSSIVGLVGYAFEEEEVGSAQERAEVLRNALLDIKEQADRCCAMVSDVLAMARSEAGRVEWRQEPIDPLQLVVAAMDTVRPMARKAGVRLEADADEEIAELLGSEDRLIQVLVNLLGNAVKFSPEGGKVRLVTRVEPDAVVFAVEDEGPGIAQERLEAIFDRYEQAGPTSMRAKGVGLGLAISREIVLQHEGSLRAENRPDRGARFTLRLPRLDVG